MEIIPVEAGPFSTNGYFVFEEEAPYAIVIDVPIDSCYQFLKLQDKYERKIKKIVLTHSHFDHIGDAYELKTNTKAEILIHPDDEYRLIKPMESLPFHLPLNIPSFKADHYINDGDLLNLVNIHFEILHTPGHTQGSICLVEKNEKVVFSGDTIFFESVGRTDLEGGSTYLLLKSIKEKILSLPEDFKIFPGHGHSTTVGYEKRHNPFIL
jgi:glyoxylase-like metal-dependent hydrolase (beta-lactamase superfamily II)